MSTRGLWTSRIGFIMAVAGSAIGLGNIWKFPYITGTNGGGLFILIYLAAVVLFGFPIMIAEFIIGRAAGTSPVGAFRKIAGDSSTWPFFGWLGVITGFIILSYYSVVAGWSMNYTLMAFTDFFKNQSPDKISGLFDILYSSGDINLFWHAMFMFVTVFVVIRGVKDGIERWSMLLMPILFIIVIFLVLYGVIKGDFTRALSFIFLPHFENLTPKTVLEAVGHSFFTLSLGMGAMITYGSYLKKDVDLVKSSIIVCVMDTTVALLACFAIFPIIFVCGFEPSAGPGLVFKTLPVVFSQLPGGMIVAILFFLLLFFAALTSAISLLEVVASYFIDEKGWHRKKATLLSGLAIFIIGIPSALAGSKGIFANWSELFGLNFFDTFDYLASNWMLPIGGLGIALFVGWFIDPELKKTEFCAGTGFKMVFPLWDFCVKYIAPTGLIIVLLNRVGLLEGIINF